MVSVVNLVVVMVGVVVIVQVIVVFHIGMSVTDVTVLMLGGVGMGAGQELGVNVVGPLRKEGPGTALCPIQDSR